MRLAAVVGLCGVAYGQIIGVHHPAAGPDFAQQGLARQLVEDDLQLESPLGPAGLVDPEGRAFVAPLKEYAKIRELELQREADEIARVLAQRNDDKQPSPSSLPFEAWLWSFVGCMLVASCGVLPAFLLPADSTAYLQSDEGKRRLNLVLSFAVGSLLGDVFLHLLPETWAGIGMDAGSVGLYTMGGLLICLLVEKLCAHTEESQHRVCAIMNLVANVVDNFTHGLAVGGSFLVSTKFGFLTTFAILLHEIPHEISDFAILLRADFDRWSAVKAQLSTASAAVIGCWTALYLHADGLTGAAACILPFTAGGFINIALVQILPELMQETRPRENLRQLIGILGGVGVMAVLNGAVF